jgi:arylsulfatase
LPTAHPSPCVQGKSGGGSDALAGWTAPVGCSTQSTNRIADKTIVVWNSDNPAGQAHRGRIDGPWRGHFGSGFEGGMRTPAIVRWPGKVAGTVTDEMFSTVD